MPSSCIVWWKLACEKALRIPTISLDQTLTESEHSACGQEPCPWWDDTHASIRAKTNQMEPVGQHSARLALNGWFSSISFFSTSARCQFFFSLIFSLFHLLSDFPWILSQVLTFLLLIVVFRKNQETCEFFNFPSPSFPTPSLWAPFSNGNQLPFWINYWYQ